MSLIGNIMKTNLIIAALLVQISVQAQFSAGVKVNFSSGIIRSSNLVENLDYQQRIDPRITYWNVDQNFGYGFGAGGFVGYELSEKFSLIAEPTVDFLKCGIDFKRIENNINTNGDGKVTTETTTSDIRVYYFNLPILARYNFTKNRFFIQGGFGINICGTPSITSQENVQKDNYNNGYLANTVIEPSYKLETKLDVFTNFKLNFVLGVGKTFDIKGKDLSIDVRYNLPITKSEMFTTDVLYNDGLFRHNDLLGIDGKIDAEKSAPFLLNDFKMSSITLSVSYVLFKK